MTDLLLQFGLSNACFSLGLAIVAVIVGKYANRPHLAHLLWVLVFVKLITPPIMNIPVVALPAQTGTAAIQETPSLPQAIVPENSTWEAPLLLEGPDNEISPLQPPVFSIDAGNIAGSAATSLPSNSWTATLRKGLTWLPHLWLFGALAVLIWSLIRVVRFNRLLMADAKLATGEVQIAAKKIANQLKLKRIPAIYTTSARISPMVWWIGGKVRIVIPAMLLEQMESRQWKLVLAHELAHVRRQDHLVRWIEWVACVSFWWNPVVWWAQRHLRAMEEICCDALVLSSIQTKPQSYANSLLKAVEYLSDPALRAPAMASELNSGETLERRFRMIVSNRANRSKSRILQAFVMVLGLVVLPLGVASAQDYEAVSKRLKASVKKGEITEKQAGAMMAALKKEAGSNQRAVGARLRAAVKAGELTADQAKKMMAALEKSGASAGKKKGKDKRSGKKDGDGRKAKYAAIEKKIIAAVREGDLSREEAGKKLAILKKKMFGDQDKKGRDKKDGGHDKSDDLKRKLRSKYRSMEEEIWAAVKAGKLLKKEAEKKLAILKKEMFGDHDKKGWDKKDRDHDKKRGGTDWDALKKKVEGAVKSGELTREEAEGIYKIEKAVEDGEITREQADMIYRIEGAVKEGKITRKQADERYRAKFGEKDGERSRSRGKEDDGKKRRYYAAEREVKKAIDEGKISAEDGRKRLERVRRALWPDKREESRKKDEPTREEYIERVEKRIKIAIEEGKITEEQGAQRMKGFLKKLEEKDREE